MVIAWKPNKALQTFKGRWIVNFSEYEFTVDCFEYCRATQVFKITEEWVAHLYQNKGLPTQKTGLSSWRRLHYSCVCFSMIVVEQILIRIRHIWIVKLPFKTRTKSSKRCWLSLPLTYLVNSCFVSIEDKNYFVSRCSILVVFKTLYCTEERPLVRPDLVLFFNKSCL